MAYLEKYRENKSLWNELSFQEGLDDNHYSIDVNRKYRYKILLELQYDWQEGDKELIRYLFEQEIIARERESCQGIGKALWLGAYLLGKYRDTSDIPLFYRAKFANFDTGCGFNREFMYLSLKDKTEKYVQENYPEIYKEIQGNYVELDLANTLDSWWESINEQYPDQEKNEDLFTLYDRYCYLGNKILAREYLEKWIADEPDSLGKTTTLLYEYKELGDYKNGKKMAKILLFSKETLWDIASIWKTLIELNRLGETFDEGLKAVEHLDLVFNQFDDWKNTGLGRIAIHEAFELSLASNNVEISRQVFQIAHSWCQKNDKIAWVGLEAAWKAARKCSYNNLAKQYKKLAAQECKRINNLI